MRSKGSFEYYHHNWSARQRQTKHKIELTRDEWITWWKDTGKFGERGNKPHNYCMSLIDRSKPYSLDNIECITNTKKDIKNGICNGTKVMSPNGIIYTSMREAMEVEKISRYQFRKLLRSTKGWVVI
jgi:hypothetical protein